MKTQIPRKSSGRKSRVPPTVGAGQSFPLGARLTRPGVNFSVFSKNATEVKLLFFGATDDSQPRHTISLDPGTNRTGHYWHVFVPGVKAGQIYGYRVAGPHLPEQGLRWRTSPSISGFSYCAQPRSTVVLSSRIQ
jgi:isoamylase